MEIVQVVNLLLCLLWENQLKTETVGRRKDRERRKEGREGEKERFSDDVNFQECTVF